MTEFMKLTGLMKGYLHSHDTEPVQVVLDLGTKKVWVKLPPGIRFVSDHTDFEIAKAKLVSILNVDGKYHLRIDEGRDGA